MPKKPPRTGLNAIKHGAYSNLGLLPGEDANEYLELHARLREEHAPSGPVAEDAVDDLAKLIWRKSRLGIYQRAKFAKIKWSKHLTDKDDPDFDVDIVLKRHLLGVLHRATVTLEHVQEHGSIDAKVMPALNDLTDTASKVFNIEAPDLDDDVAVEEANIHLALLGDLVTTDQLLKELELAERLDAKIDRVLKRLMQLKTMNQMGDWERQQRALRPERLPHA